MTTRSGRKRRLREAGRITARLMRKNNADLLRMLEGTTAPNRIEHEGTVYIRTGRPTPFGDATYVPEKEYDAKAYQRTRPAHRRR